MEGRKEVARRRKTVSMDVKSRNRKRDSVTTVLLEDLTINYHSKFFMQFHAELVLLSQT
jgi:hypothetical protein